MINQDEVFVITEEDILKPKYKPKAKSNGKDWMEGWNDDHDH